jgi:environmental stress-induced protein Ves
MKLIRHANLTPMPWKNGGGVTLEAAICPEGASLNAFAWRISMAQVAGDGPFSVFPQIDRILYLLSGNGIVLRVAGRAHELRRGDRLDFPADVPVDARLLDGPVDDLNIMVDRRLARADIEEHAVTGEAMIVLPGSSSHGGQSSRDMSAGRQSVLFVREGRITLAGVPGRPGLEARDMLLLDETDEHRIAVAGEAQLVAIGFTMLAG